MFFGIDLNRHRDFSFVTKLYNVLLIIRDVAVDIAVATVIDVISVVRNRRDRDHDDKGCNNKASSIPTTTPRTTKTIQQTKSWIMRRQTQIVRTNAQMAEIVTK